jgi:hypothetical protein
VSRTHCKNGHEFTEDNVYVSGGRRRCRTCARARVKAHYDSSPEFRERMINTARAYYQQNHGRISLRYATDQEYAQRIKDRSAARYQQHKEEIKQRRRERYAEQKHRQDGA